MRMHGRKFNDPQLAHDLAAERTEVSRTLAGALAEHHRAGGDRLTEDDLLDVEVLATKAAGLIRRLAGQLERARAADDLVTIAIDATPGESRLAPELGGYVSVPAPAPESGWRTMDSAPRDGSWFLAYRAQRRAPWRIYVGSWTDRILDGGPGRFCDEHGDPSEPSHWMPLPSPPPRIARCGGMCWREGCGGQCHLSDGHEIEPCRCKSGNAGPPREPKVGDRVRITDGWYRGSEGLLEVNVDRRGSYWHIRLEKSLVWCPACCFEVIDAGV